MKDLVKYLDLSNKLEKKKEELAKVSAELENIDSAIDILGESSLGKSDFASTIYRYRDALNKKEKILQYTIATIELDIAKFELEQAYAE